MKRYKLVDGDYILGVGSIGNDDTIEIGEEEYNRIISLVSETKPKALAGYGFRLKTDFTWEEYKLPPIEPEPPTAEEALTRYANELTGADDPDLLSAAETLIKQRTEE